MADEPTAPEPQDQPVSEAPPEGTSAPEESFTDVNLDEQPDEITPEFLRERYEQMQRDYTQKTQGLGEQRRAYEQAGIDPDWIEAYTSDDPEQLGEAVHRLLVQRGIDPSPLFEQEEEEPEFDEEEEGPEPYVTREEWEAQQAQFQQEQMAEVAEAMEEHIDQLAGERNLSVRDAEGKLNQLGMAIANEAWANGEPDPENTQKVFAGWAQQLEQHGEQKVEALREQKRGTPSPPQKGSSGTPEIDVNDPRQRLKRANEVASQALDGG